MSSSPSWKRSWLPSPVTLCLLLLLPTLSLRPDETAPIPVRLMEGAIHGFLVLTTLDGKAVGSGDLRQTSTSKGVEGRTVFHFNDGSFSEETVVFTEDTVFSLRRYELIQRGPAFQENVEIVLDRSSAKYRVKTKNHKDGKERSIDGVLDLPADVYNGMIFTVAKNLPKGTTRTVQVVAFMPEPRLIQLKMTPAGDESITIDRRSKSATRYILHPELGAWAGLFAKVTGRTPPDEHLWILADPVPAFIKFEGPFYVGGPVWRMELGSPRFPADKHQ